MARDKLSNFLWFYFLVNLFCFFLAHKVSINHKTATQGLRREASAVAREQYTKPLRWGTTLSKTHDMPKKARVAREQPSPGLTPSVIAPVVGGMAWTAQLHAVIL